MSNISYYPIVKSKLGELEALSLLNSDVKARIVPIVQIMPLKVEKPEQFQKKYNELLKRLKLNDFPFIYIDTYFIWQNRDLCNNLFTDLRDLQINVKPVIRQLSPVEHLDFLNGNGFLNDQVCIRVVPEQATAKRINIFYQLLSERYNFSRSQSNLLMDFEYVSSPNLAHYINSFQGLLAEIIEVNSINSLIVGAGAFPKDVNAIEADTIGYIQRYDIELYQRIKEGLGLQELAYADYCNIHPIYEETQEQFLGSCTIKYTTNDSFAILRGKRPSNHPLGNGQYVVKSQTLLDQGYYTGPDFCYGDKCVFDCANGTIGTGNSQKWVTYTANHHISLVVQQV